MEATRLSMRRAEAAVRDWLDRVVGPGSGTVPTLRMDLDGVVFALRMGRFPNERELGVRSRNGTEGSWFGLREGMADESYPHYGELRRPGDDPGGAVVVWLKRGVRDRTTFLLEGGAEPSAVEEPSLVSASAEDALFFPWIEVAYDGIAEAQVHGGVSWDDVSEISFPADPGDRILLALDERGVLWQIEEATQAPSPPTTEEPEGTQASIAAVGLGSALVATGAAAAPLAIGAVAVKQGADAVVAGTAMVLNSLALMSQADNTAEIVAATARTLMPDAPMDEIDELVEQERAFQAEFMRKLRARVSRDLPTALRTGDAAARRAAVQKIVERERRFIRMRREAMNARLRAASEQRKIREVSPQGALWVLSDSVRNHTPDCLAMAGKVWPWSVLRLYHPPMHHGCPCKLVGIQDAIRRGLMRPNQVPEAGDALRRARAIIAKATRLEELASADVVDEYLAVIEADHRHQLRYAKGTAKGGQFRPRRGASAPSVRGVMKKAGREAGSLLHELVPERPKMPASNPRTRVVAIRGHRVAVPEARDFKRSIDGYAFTSPAGGTNVYRDGVLVSTPDGPANDGDVRQWSVAGRLFAGDPPKQQAEIERARGVVLGVADKSDLKGLDREALDAALRQEGFVPTHEGDEAREYRHTDGSTATFTYGADGKVEAALIERRAVPVEADFSRNTKKPGDWDTFVADAASTIGLIAARTHSKWAPSDVAFDDTLSDHTGLHTWEGHIVLAPRIRGDVQDALARVARGEKDPFPAATYRAYHTVAHELLHGLNPVGFRSYASGENAGMPLEEALTEELAHVVTTELLSEHGLTDVAQWAANNPTHPARRGIYTRYRGSLDGILNEAKIAPGDRPSLLWAMKASMSPEQRVAFLADKAGWSPERVAEAMNSGDRVIDVPMLGAAPHSSVEPRAFKMGSEQVGPGAILVLRGGQVVKVAEVGEKTGVVFARATDGRLVTASDVAVVHPPAAGYGPDPKRYPLAGWGLDGDLTIGVGDEASFGYETRGVVEDLLHENGLISAVRVGTEDGSVWVTRARMRPGSTVTIQKALAPGDAPRIREPVRGGSWKQAGFESSQEAAEETLLLSRSPHLARLPDAELEKRLATMRRLASRGRAARDDLDRTEIEAETFRINRLREARSAARLEVRQRTAARQRARDGFLVISQQEYDFAMEHATEDGAPLPDGSYMAPSDLFDATHDGLPVGSVHIMPESALPSPLTVDAALYRADMLSPEARMVALREADAFADKVLGPDWEDAVAENSEEALVTALYARRAGMPVPPALARALGELAMANPAMTRLQQDTPFVMTALGRGHEGISPDAHRVYQAGPADAVAVGQAFEALTYASGESSLVQVGNDLLTMRELSRRLPDGPNVTDPEMKYQAAVFAAAHIDPPSAYMQAVGWDAADLSNVGLGSVTYEQVRKPVVSEGDNELMSIAEARAWNGDSKTPGVMMVSVPSDQRVALEAHGVNTAGGRSPWGAGMWARPYSMPEHGDSVPVALRLMNPVRVKEGGDEEFQRRYVEPVQAVLRERGMSPIDVERDRMIRDRILADGHDGVLVGDGMEAVAMADDTARPIERVEFDYSDAPPNLTYEQEREFAQTFRGVLGRSVFVQGRRNFVPLDEEWERISDDGSVRFWSPAGTTKIHRSERVGDGWGDSIVASAPRWRRTHPDLRQRRPSTRVAGVDPMAPVPATVPDETTRAVLVNREYITRTAQVNFRRPGDGAVLEGQILGTPVNGRVRVGVVEDDGSITPYTIGFDDLLAVTAMSHYSHEEVDGGRPWWRKSWSEFMDVARKWHPEGYDPESDPQLASSLEQAWEHAIGLVDADPDVEDEAWWLSRMGHIEIPVLPGMAQVYGRLSLPEWRAETIRSPQTAAAVLRRAIDAGLPVKPEAAAWLGEEDMQTRFVEWDGVVPQSSIDWAQTLVGIDGVQARQELQERGFLGDTGGNRFTAIMPEGSLAVAITTEWNGSSGWNVSGVQTDWAPNPNVNAPERTIPRLLGEANTSGSPSVGEDVLQRHGFVPVSRVAQKWVAPDGSFFVEWSSARGGWAQVPVLRDRDRQEAAKALAQAGRYEDAVPVGTNAQVAIVAMAQMGTLSSTELGRVTTVYPPESTSGTVYRAVFEGGVVKRFGPAGAGEDDFATPENLGDIEGLRAKAAREWDDERMPRIQTLIQRFDEAVPGQNPVRTGRGRTAQMAVVDDNDVDVALQELDMVRDFGRSRYARDRRDAQGRITRKYVNRATQAAVTVRFEERIHGGKPRLMLEKLVKLELPSGRIKGGTTVGGERVIGRLPQTAAEYADDALALLHELQEKHNVPEHRRLKNTRWEFATASSRGSGVSGHSGVREWGGTIRVGKACLPSLNAGIEARAEGRELTYGEKSGIYATYKVMAHELLHAVRECTSGEYHRHGGQGIEEAITEELAHPLAARWMQEHGYQDVVQWSQENPNDDRVLGSYRGHRKNLKAILDDAMYAQSEREPLLMKMRYEMDGDDRLRLLDDLLNATPGGRTNGQSAAARLSGSNRAGNTYEPGFRNLLPIANAAQPVETGQVLLTRKGEVVRVIGSSGPSGRQDLIVLDAEGKQAYLKHGDVIPLGVGVDYSPDLPSSVLKTDRLGVGSLIRVNGRLGHVEHLYALNMRSRSRRYGPGLTVYYADGEMDVVKPGTDFDFVSPDPRPAVGTIVGVKKGSGEDFRIETGPITKVDGEFLKAHTESGDWAIQRAQIVPPLAAQGDDEVFTVNGELLKAGDPVRVDGREGILWRHAEDLGHYTILSQGSEFVVLPDAKVESLPYSREGETRRQFTVRSMPGGGAELEAGMRVTTPNGDGVLAGFREDDGGWVAVTTKGVFEPMDLSPVTLREPGIVRLSDGKEAWVGVFVKVELGEDDAPTMARRIAEVLPDGRLLLDGGDANQGQDVRYPDGYKRADGFEDMNAPRPEPGPPPLVNGEVTGGRVNEGNWVVRRVPSTLDGNEFFQLGQVASISRPGTKLRVTWNSSNNEMRGVTAVAGPWGDPTEIESKDLLAAASTPSGHWITAGSRVRDVRDEKEFEVERVVYPEGSHYPEIKLVGESVPVPASWLYVDDLPDWAQEGRPVQIAGGGYGYSLGIATGSQSGEPELIVKLRNGQELPIPLSNVSEWDPTPVDGARWTREGRPIAGLVSSMRNLRLVVEGGTSEQRSLAAGIVAQKIVGSLSDADMATLVRDSGSVTPDMGSMSPESVLVAALQAIYVDESAARTLEGRHPKLYEWARGTADVNGLPRPDWIPRIEREITDPAWAAQTFNGQFGGLRAVVSYYEDDYGDMKAMGDVYDDWGIKVGEFIRNISPDMKRVGHEKLKLDDSMQGTGFGSAFLKNSEENYRLAGLDTISVTAALQNGGYTWAALGFQLDADDVVAASIIQGLVRQARVNGAITPEEYGELYDRLYHENDDDGTPEKRFDPKKHLHRISDLAFIDGQPSSRKRESYNLGQRILVGQSWTGVKYL